MNRPQIPPGFGVQFVGLVHFRDGRREIRSSSYFMTPTAWEYENDNVPESVRRARAEQALIIRGLALIGSDRQKLRGLPFIRDWLSRRVRD